MSNELALFARTRDHSPSLATENRSVDPMGNPSLLNRSPQILNVTPPESLLLSCPLDGEAYVWRFVTPG